MSLVSVNQVAQAMNITARRVQQLAEEGMPRAGYGSYDLGQCMAWYIRFLQNAVEDRDIPQMRAEVVPIALFEERLARVITSARQRLLMLPARVAPELEGLDRAPLDICFRVIRASDWRTLGVQIKVKLAGAIRAMLIVLSHGPRKPRRRARPAATAPAQPTNGHAVEAVADPCTLHSLADGF